MTLLNQGFQRSGLDHGSHLYTTLHTLPRLAQPNCTLSLQNCFQNSTTQLYSLYRIAFKTKRQNRERKGQKDIGQDRAPRNKKQKMGCEAECLQLAAFSFIPAELIRMSKHRENVRSTERISETQREYQKHRENIRNTRRRIEC